MANLIRRDNLGAWLIKCNPLSNPELVRQLDQPDPPVVTQWCVADNYRSRMMRPGDPALLWFSGNGRHVCRGIWGLGRVTGTLAEGHGDGGTPGPVTIPLDVRLLTRGEELAASELVEAGVTDLEVQVTPAMSNPSWVSKDQLARIEALMEASSG
ncbi:hypothetical protein ACOCJ5_12725 [Knoellia sp. CPCC 206450]|uniref:hypothetical protein n=1 Tax=Knoellia tibetensis TaxID=3404798 RepID=UPI003B438641